VLGGWLADGTCNLEEATRIATQIGSGNARRLYPL
jgi:hypothetical protein